MTFDNLILLTGSGTRWLQLFVSLSLLIVLHEFGHYYFAKKFKMRVEKFYLFFDFLFPFSGLLNFSLFKKKKNDTEYGVGWFPLGGYVKIAGMVDESMDKEELAQPPKPWEYRSKPAWQRLLTMLGGIIVNVVVAMLIYSVVFAVWGEEYLPAANAKYGIHTDSLGQSVGLRDGDIVLGTNGQKAERWSDLSSSIVIKGAKTVEVSRDGQPLSLPLSSEMSATIIQRKKPLFELRVPALVGEVVGKSEASKMDLRAGDSITAINGEPVTYFHEVQAKLADLKGKPIRLNAYRKQTLVVLNGNVDSNGKLGFGIGEVGQLFKTEKIHYNPIQAIVRGVSYTGERFASYASSFSLLFKKGVKLKDNLGGIGTFSKIFPTEFDLQDFLELTAFISIVLAFMNLLPIPGLDGGYVIFLLYELITRRKVSEKVMEVATTAGLILLLALMLYANGLDVFRAFK